MGPEVYSVKLKNFLPAKRILFEKAVSPTGIILTDNSY